jgi:DNA-binding NtrC family response regulator
LRERREDIVPLAETLLAQLAGAAGRKEIPALSDEAKTRLTAGAWAGNVRELRNALERAMILQDGPVLDAELFGASPGREDQPGDDASLEGLERRAIETALAAVGGNRRVAAARLGISVRTLYDKLKRYDLR